MVKTLTTQTNPTTQMVLNSFSVEEDTVVCKRIVNPTPEQAQISLDQAIYLAKAYGIKKYLIDARGTMPPNAELRKTLRTFMEKLIGHYDTIVVVIDEHSPMKVSAQFLFHNHEITHQTRFELYTSIDEARAFLSRD